MAQVNDNSLTDLTLISSDDRSIVCIVHQMRPSFSPNAYITRISVSIDTYRSLPGLCVLFPSNDFY